MKRIKELNHIFKSAETIEELIEKLERLPNEVKKGRLKIETKLKTPVVNDARIRWADRLFNDRVRFRVEYEDNPTINISIKTI